jgi:hypothetical protein
MNIDVLVEPFYEWVVDASQIKGKCPDITGITYVEDPLPYIERKLLTVNAGHSAIAYLGYVRGKPTIHAALEDDEVRETASKTLEETSLLLIKEYGPVQKSVHLGRRNPGRARPHPETRPQRALCLTCPAPARHGAHAGAPGDGYRGGTALRLFRGRGSKGTTGDDTRGRRTFGAGPVRRDRRGPSAGRSRRRTDGSRSIVVV